jgi:hypothetical protein
MIKNPRYTNSGHLAKRALNRLLGVPILGFCPFSGFFTVLTEILKTREVYGNGRDAAAALIDFFTGLNSNKGT